MCRAQRVTISASRVHPRAAAHETRPPLSDSPCAPPAARRDRCETSKLRAARALAPALPVCRRQKVRTGRPKCAPHAARRDRGETSKLTRAGRTFNSIMSRIRIHVENCFAGQHKTLNFLSYAPARKIGGRSTHRKYVVANFLMNVLTTFNGNQISTATGMRPPTLEDLLRRAE